MGGAPDTDVFSPSDRLDRIKRWYISGCIPANGGDMICSEVIHRDLVGRQRFDIGPLQVFGQKLRLPGGESFTLNQ